MRARVRRWNAALAENGGLPEGSLAEAFVVKETTSGNRAFHHFEWLIRRKGTSMPRTVLDPFEVDEADVVAFPTPMVCVTGSLDGIHVEVHVATDDATAARAFCELQRLATVAMPGPGHDALTRIACAADVLADALVLAGIRCVGIAIGTELTSGGHAGSGSFEIADPHATCAVLIDHDGDRSGISTAWARSDASGRAALTVRAQSANGALDLARRSANRPALAGSLLTDAGADGWLIYPDGRIERCA